MTEARADVLRTVAFSGIAATYNPIGTAISHNWRVWRITNPSDGDLFISFDGVNDNLFIAAGTFVLYDISTNSDQDASVPLSMSKGTQYYVRYSTAPTTKGVYLEGFYQKGQ